MKGIAYSLFVGDHRIQGFNNIFPVEYTGFPVEYTGFPVEYHNNDFMYLK